MTGQNMFGTLVLVALATPTGAEPFRGSAVSWWVFAPSRNAFDAATVTLDPPVRGGPGLSSICLGQIQDDGTASGQCHIEDGGGNGWDETFLCDLPLARAPLSMPASPGTTGCQGEVEVTGGSGIYTGQTGRGLFTLYKVSVTPDGRVIGYALRQYGSGF